MPLLSTTAASVPSSAASFAPSTCTHKHILLDAVRLSTAVPKDGILLYIPYDWGCLRALCSSK